MITVTTTPADTDSPHVADRAGASFPTAVGQTARRTTMQFRRTPQLLILPTVTVALFLFLYRYIFGGAIDPGGGVDYVDFLVPGFLVAAILWAGMGVPSGVAEDASSGVHDRFRSLPIPRAAVVTGRSLADAALVSCVLGVNALLGYAVGFRPDADPGAVVLAFALVLMANYVFIWVFISLGLAAGNAQAAQGMASLAVIPLTFASSAYVPMDSLPSWMEPVAANQPLNVIINAVRSLLLGGTDAAGIGHTTTYWVVLALAWCAGILTIFSTIAITRSSRTR